MDRLDESPSASGLDQHSLAALRESELRYRIVADFTHDWEYWLAPDGALRYVSPSCKRVTGYSVAEFISDPGLLDDLVVPADRHLWADHHRDVPDSGHVTMQFRIRTKDGQTRWIEHICQCAGCRWRVRPGSDRVCHCRFGFYRECLLKEERMKSFVSRCGSFAGCR